MPLSTSNSERPIPDLPWARMAVAGVLIAAVGALGWELHVRSRGFAPTLNDSSDLWAERREAVRPESMVIIGDSRPLFGLDLDELERGFGKRPIQLALAGSCAYPVLEHLANDETFRGTVLCGMVPGMFFAPGGPLVATSEKAIRRYQTWSPAQRAGHYLALPLEERIAFLKQDELTLAMLLKTLPIPDRPHAQVGPALPPYFNHLDRERRARMTAQAEQPGRLRDLIRQRWLPLFTPPPPPSYVPPDVFMKEMGLAMEVRMKNTVAAVAKIQARGGEVIFIRFPISGELKTLEDKLTPRRQTWDPLLQATGAAGVHFEDHPELAHFDCPEWSHLSAADSVVFTRALVPHLQRVSKFRRIAQTGGAPAPH